MIEKHSLTGLSNLKTKVYDPYSHYSTFYNYISIINDEFLSNFQFYITNEECNKLDIYYHIDENTKLSVINNKSVIYFTNYNKGKKVYCTVFCKSVDYDEVYKDIYEKLNPINNDEKESNIHIISLTSSGSFTLTSTDKTKIIIPDIDKSYNDDFKDVHNYVVENLKTETKGVYLFHGPPGTGKTTYIKYLSTLIPDRKFIYIPNILANNLSTPEFVSFLISSCVDSVLVIEDGDDILRKREDGNSTLSTILNISDGILSDILNISIILTYNTDDINIDPAILRKGRVKAKYKFDKLSISKGKGINSEVNEELTLAEIYNMEEIDYSKREKAKKKSFGFQTKK